VGRVLEVRTPDGLQGVPVLAADGSTLGVVRRLVLSARQHEPRWLEVELAEGAALRLVPVAAASHDGAALTVPYSAGCLLTAPAHVGHRVSARQARRLDEHYGLTAGSSGAA